MISKQVWKDDANKVYPGLKTLIKDYKKILKLKSNEYLRTYEQTWFDENLTPIIDFMGDEDVWTTIIPNIHLIGICTRKGRSECSGISIVPRAHFSGTHWTSCKALESKWFNPYDHFQVSGTNQFCQTFSMMYLLDKLPNKLSTSSWTRNYTYTQDALRFIQNVIQKLSKIQVIKDNYNMKELTKSVNECLKYPNICFNGLEF